MEHNNIDSCIEEWETLSNEYRSLEKLHKLYQAKLEEVNSLQQKCIKGIAHQRYRLNIIKTSLKRLGKSSLNDGGEEKERNNLLQTDLLRRKAQLYEMENILPKPSGHYLKIILGSINVSILDKNDKFRYKDEYEKFKLVMSLIALGISIINCLTNYRTMDVIHMFLLVWYYCTLTIRESILKVNGSRMKGWWRAHHFISTVLAGVMLIWPVGVCYKTFRTQFMAFNVYISFVQYLQFMYQRGCLYRLKCLGQSHNMDITVEGFQSWMWKGLGFLLPFLFIGYFWELYQAYNLYQLMSDPSADWHVGTLCALFLVLFLGNSITTAAIIPQKLNERLKLKYRFTRLDKYMWTHKKRKVSFRNPESSERRTPAARAASFSRKLNNKTAVQYMEASAATAVPVTNNVENLTFTPVPATTKPEHISPVELSSDSGMTSSARSDSKGDVGVGDSLKQGKDEVVATTRLSPEDDVQSEDLTHEELEQLQPDECLSDEEEEEEDDDGGSTTDDDKESKKDK